MFMLFVLQFCCLVLLLRLGHVLLIIMIVLIGTAQALGRDDGIYILIVPFKLVNLNETLKKWEKKKREEGA